MSKIVYTCICGRTFSSSQGLNGHRSHCEQYLISVNKLNSKIKIQKNLSKWGKTNAKKRHTKAQLKHLSELTNWIAEQHTCECCGKIMTEKFGSGRFCCRACANSRRHSDTSKEQLKIKCRFTKFNIDKKQKAQIKYYNNPKYCRQCNKMIPYDYRHRQFCCNECENKFKSIKAKSIGFGGITKGHGNGIAGYYKGTMHQHM